MLHGCSSNAGPVLMRYLQKTMQLVVLWSLPTRAQGCSRVQCNAATGGQDDPRIRPWACRCCVGGSGMRWHAKLPNMLQPQAALLRHWCTLASLAPHKPAVDQARPGFHIFPGVPRGNEFSITLNRIATLAHYQLRYVLPLQTTHSPSAQLVPNPFTSPVGTSPQRVSRAALPNSDLSMRCCRVTTAHATHLACAF